MQLHKKIHSGRCRDVEWSVGEGVVQNCGSPGLEQWRVRIGNGGSSDRSDGTAVDFEGPPVCVATWRLSLTPLQQSGCFTGSDEEKSNIWLLEIFGCNIMFVEGKFESPKCQDWRIREMHKPSILGGNHCCATQKLAFGSCRC